MEFFVKAYHADHPLTVTKESAKDAFEKAVEWHVEPGTRTGAEGKYREQYAY